MRRIALINQKGGVGKTTVTVNLGAALARAGKRVVVVDLDPQANLTLYLGVELASGAPSTYRVLTGEVSFGAALRPTSTPNLRVLPTDIHLSGAELEISGSDGREGLLRRALEDWCTEHAGSRAGRDDGDPADYVLYDCPPSLGLLSLNALAAADEVFLVVQTQFLALQGTSKLIEVIELVKQELHPRLRLTGIVPCLYDSRMRLAREVLSELRRYFPTQVFRTPISTNVKLAESPSFAKTIFEYAPESIGARDFASLAHEVLTQEALELAGPATAVPGPKSRKRGALESYASSAASQTLEASQTSQSNSASTASGVPGELVPVAPRIRKRARKPTPGNGTTSPEAPVSEARATSEVEPPQPAPLSIPVQDPGPTPLAAGTRTARRGRSKPAESG